MITNKNRFKNEEQFEIALESINKAYYDKYSKTGIEDMGYEQYQDFVDLLLCSSDKSAFTGTNEEIRVGWYDTEMFE